MHLYESRELGLCGTEKKEPEESLICKKFKYLGEADTYEEAWLVLRHETVSGRVVGPFDAGYVKQFLEEAFERQVPAPKKNISVLLDLLLNHQIEALAQFLTNSLEIDDKFVSADGGVYDKEMEAVEANKKWLEKDCYATLRNAAPWHDDGSNDAYLSRPFRGLRN